MTITVLTAIGALAALVATLMWMLKRECVDLAREEALSTTQTRILNRSSRLGIRQTMSEYDERWY
jgi:hypothetical protein